jgi:hypothetical protein
LVTKEVTKAKNPVFASKYHSLSQTCDKRIVSWNPGMGATGNITLIGSICDTRCKEYLHSKPDSRNRFKHNFGIFDLGYPNNVRNQPDCRLRLKVAES